MDITRVATKNINEREVNDFYATDPKHFEYCLNWYIERFNLDFSNLSVLEPCCGNGHISDVLKKYFSKVVSYDLIKRQYPLDKVKDLFELTKKDIQDFDYIITNPPFKVMNDITKHLLDIMQDKQKLMMLVPLAFLETKGRYDIFKTYPIKEVHVPSFRINCVKGGDFEKYTRNSSQVYCLVLFEQNFKGVTSLYHIPYEPLENLRRS